MNILRFVNIGGKMGTVNSTPITGTNAPQASVIKPQSKIDKFNKWFFEPLSKCDAHGSFIILLVCLPLYEKYLRNKDFIGESENFTEGHKVFRSIGKDIVVPEKVAFSFWQIFRNGLCHRGMPKQIDLIRYELVRNSDFIANYDDKQKVLKVNAFKFRDLVLNLIRADINIFKDTDYPFAEEYAVDN